MAKKAEDYLVISTGIADTSYWGPEAEFYIFDDVRFGQTRTPGSTSSTRSREPGTQVSSRRVATSDTSPGTRRATSRSRRPITTRTFVRR